MKFKHFVTVLLMCVMMGLASWLANRTKPAEEPDKNPFEELTAEQISEIHIIDKNAAIKIFNKNGEWLVGGVNAYAADHRKIGPLLYHLANMKMSQKVELTDLGKRFLENPKLKKENSGLLISLYKDSSLINEIILGEIFYEERDGKKYASGRYIYFPVMKKAYLVTTSFDQIRADEILWKDKTFARTRTAKKIELYMTEKLLWTFHRESIVDELKLVDTDKKLNLETVGRLEQYIEYMDFIRAKRRQTEMDAEYKFRILTFDGLQYELSFAKQDDDNMRQCTIEVSLNEAQSQTLLPGRLKLLHARLKKEKFLYERWKYYFSYSQYDYLLSAKERFINK